MPKRRRNPGNRRNNARRNQQGQGRNGDEINVDGIKEMLKDVVTTKTYQNVIYQNKFLFKNKIVLDVGAGTGILSLFCAKAGAAHVYAVECSDMTDMTKKIVESNGFSEVVTVLKGEIEEIELPVAKVYYNFRVDGIFSIV
ncbi:protein arginine N-methyltransferase 1.1-like [Manihot esculenta]|uniref:protein arginine N-methyltransferase 1.1-like n=1 Tax=Manihot esculenta TaxID=3983 RepID=UPI001CC46F93|nr:protein arginine N-methyltransferase 1.1-like [Manihot esculenta]